MFSLSVLRAALPAGSCPAKALPTTATSTLLHPHGSQCIHTSGGPQKSRIKWNYTRPQFYLTKKTNKAVDEPLTAANRAFVQQVLQDTYASQEEEDGRYAYKRLEGSSEVEDGPVASSLLKGNLRPWPRGSYADPEWPITTRVGLLARKIGVVPMWKTDGKPIMTTMLHVEDNHVVRYIPPEDFIKTTVAQRRLRPAGEKDRQKGVGWPSLVVGALSGDPQKFTKDYCGLFTDSGVMPKKLMARFPVSANAVIQPGTPLYASHFQPGQFIDVRGKSARRGFQGVMKRHGFSGGASDERGVTKSHRRPGCIGSGRDKSRVWPGQKLPGHVGNRNTLLIGMQIVRINYKYNVIYVNGHNVMGEPGEMVKLFDSKVTPKQWGAPKMTLKAPRHFPTCYPEEHDQMPEEEFAEGFFDYNQPSITYKK